MINISFFSPKTRSSFGFEGNPVLAYVAMTMILCSMLMKNFNQYQLIGVGLASLLLMFFCACASTEQSPLARKSNKLISVSGIRGRVIIDPGHGGEDAGAVGPTGLKEKDLTLDMALRMRRLLKKVMPQVEVVLTRTSDRYVSLEDRVKLANTAGGDLFLSLHINSSERKEASGFELYSLDVASNSHADRLAARENKSGGLSSKALKFILADLRANANREESDQLAGLISQGLKNQLTKKIPLSKLNDRGYNQALFYVLFVKMPAVLGEMFFISNPREEALLKKADLRELCARGMVLGVKHYLDNRVIRAQNGR